MSRMSRYKAKKGCLNANRKILGPGLMLQAVQHGVNPGSSCKGEESAEGSIVPAEARFDFASFPGSYQRPPLVQPVRQVFGMNYDFTTHALYFFGRETRVVAPSLVNKIVGVTLMRGTTKTVNDLAANLELTENAVRAHLLSLERDGLVRQSGVQRGTRKPHFAELTGQAENLFPKAYDALRNQLIAVLKRRLTPRVLKNVLREDRELVFVNLVTGSHLDESVDLLKRVLTTSPGRNDLVFLLAQVYLRKEDYKTARQLLQRLTQNQSDTQLSRQAHMMLEHLASTEEQVARFEAMRNSAESNGTPTLARRGDGAAPADPASALQAALRKPGEGETQVQGTLLRIDCDAKGITVVVKVDDRTLKLHTDRFENLRIIAFTTDAGREISCGTRKALDVVVVCYLPSQNATAKADGEAKSIEFVPRDFKLRAQT
jgi:DNA-binding transcriptional ArsR family regulator